MQHCSNIKEVTVTENGFVVQAGNHYHSNEITPQCGKEQET
jgi:hypothetical protein